MPKATWYETLLAKSHLAKNNAGRIAFSTGVIIEQYSASF